MTNAEIEGRLLGAQILFNLVFDELRACGSSLDLVQMRDAITRELYANVVDRTKTHETQVMESAQDFMNQALSALDR